jgi:hypothetical protein
MASAEVSEAVAVKAFPHASEGREVESTVGFLFVLLQI